MAARRSIVSRLALEPVKCPYFDIGPGRSASLQCESLARWRLPRPFVEVSSHTPDFDTSRRALKEGRSFPKRPAFQFLAVACKVDLSRARIEGSPEDRCSASRMRRNALPEPLAPATSDVRVTLAARRQRIEAKRMRQQPAPSRSEAPFSSSPFKAPRRPQHYGAVQAGAT